MKPWKLGLILGIVWGLSGLPLTMIGLSCVDENDQPGCMENSPEVPEIVYTLFLIPILMAFTLIAIGSTLSFATGLDLLLPPFILLALILPALICGLMGAGLGLMIEKIKNENK